MMYHTLARVARLTGHSHEKIRQDALRGVIKRLDVQGETNRTPMLFSTAEIGRVYGIDAEGDPKFATRRHDDYRAIAPAQRRSEWKPTR